MLKWLAAILMLIDHLGYYLDFMLPQEVMTLMRLVGRLSFPLFAYLVALGACRTRSMGRYWLRMTFFAVLTQLAFWWASGVTQIGTFINVMFTFSLALLMAIGWEFMTDRIELLVKNPDNKADGRSIYAFLAAWPRSVQVIVGGLFLLGAPLLAIRFNPDYGFYGVITVFLFYLVLRGRARGSFTIRQQPKLFWWLLLVVILVNAGRLGILMLENRSLSIWNTMQAFSAFAILFLWLEKPREKGRPRLVEKYFFYLFYPLHIVGLMFLASYLQTVV